MLVLPGATLLRALYAPSAKPAPKQQEQRPVCQQGSNSDDNYPRYRFDSQLRLQSAIC